MTLSSAPASGDKRALLIGIDKYPIIKQLDGCTNDSRLMRSVLEDCFGFPSSNITMLLDDQATRERILAELDRLVEATGVNDMVVVHYAGHGSQMTDREGDEPSGLDNTIMPFDSGGWRGPQLDISDDEIHLRLQKLAEKTPFTTLIFDSCHSGSITRDAFGVKSRGIEPDQRPVSELPPSPIPASQWQGQRDSGPTGWLPIDDRYVLIAGCRDEETSYEYHPPEGDGKIAHGAMTYFLCAELRRATPGTTYRDVFERAAANVNAAHSSQHSQMEGRIDREVFGVADIEPMRFVRATGRSGDVVTLGAGAALGMTAGSRWTVYPQGTKRADSATALGEVEVASVRAVSTDARVVSESSPGAIVADGRAIETSHSYGDFRLRVQLIDADGDRQAVEALDTELAGSPLLRLVGPDEPASARIYMIGPRASAAAGDPAPQLGALAEPTWAMVGDTGQLLGPTKPASASGDVKRNLETIARYRQALSLDNPSPDSAVRGLVSFELLRERGDGWVVAEPESAGGEVVFEEGELVGFRVKNNSATPLFVSVLDFSLAGTIGVVYPPRGANDKIVPGASFEYGTDPGRARIRLAPEREAITDVETFKLIATTGEADFSFLRQEGVRAAGGPSSPLSLLWQTATGKATTRAAVVELPSDGEDWTTVVRSFALRPRSSAPLKSSGEAVTLGTTLLSAPGVAGEVRRYVGKSGRAEASELSQKALTDALDNAGVSVKQTIEISGASTTVPVTRGAEPRIALELSDPGPGYGQMVLAADENGMVSWHFAPEAASATRGAAASRRRRYEIPHAGAPAGAGQPATRGLIGAAGKKFLKEMVFPLIDPLIGEVSESYALRWEKKHRPYRLRTFTPDDYTTPTGRELGGEDWARLSASNGRSLLLVHGTFSRAHSAFGALPKPFVEQLHQTYEGRVFAFDHLTLSQDPEANVAWLMDHLPDGTALDLDIVCHSRGGLVSRVLSEKQGELALGSRRIRVGRLVFVGSPNAGTTLAHPQYMSDFIDTYTNLLNFIPDNFITDVLDGVVTVAKQLAVGALKGLPGLQAMRPDGDFGKKLNTGARSGDTRYFALASDFTPAEPGLKQLATNKLMDRIFKAKNDLVVPTDGVFAPNGSGFFPIEQPFVFSGTDAVAHTGFFASRPARDKILEWLRG